MEIASESQRGGCNVRRTNLVSQDLTSRHQLEVCCSCGNHRKASALANCRPRFSKTEAILRSRQSANVNDASGQGRKDETYLGLGENDTLGAAGERYIRLVSPLRILNPLLPAVIRFGLQGLLVESHESGI